MASFAQSVYEPIVTSHDNIIVKTVMNENIHRFPVPKGPHGFEVLCNMVSKIYALPHFVLRYTDDEGDTISMTVHEEFLEAIRVNELAKVPVLRFRVDECEERFGVRFTSTPLSASTLMTNPQLFAPSSQPLSDPSSGKSLPSFPSPAPVQPLAPTPAVAPTPSPAQPTPAPQPVSQPPTPTPTPTPVATTQPPVAQPTPTPAQPPKQPEAEKHSTLPFVTRRTEDLSQFRKEFTQNERKEMSGRMKAQYRDCIPLIVEKCPDSRAPFVEQKKFLAPKSETIPEFLKGLKTFIKTKGDPTGLEGSHELYLFVNAEDGFYNLAGNMNMLKVYEEYKSKDDFLYLMFSHTPQLN